MWQKIQKHLKFKELEAAQLPRSLDDVDLAVHYHELCHEQRNGCQETGPFLGKG